MPHIHTDKGQHDFTVTAFIVRTDLEEPKVLLHMHRKLHTLLPVGGHVELVETPWQAMAHELREESGYQLDQLKILQPTTRIKHLSKVALHPLPMSMNTHDITPEHFHTDIQYAFVATGEPRSNIAEGESSDLHWLTAQELGALPESAIFVDVRETYRFLLEDVLPNWDKVDTHNFLLGSPLGITTANEQAH